MSGGVSDQWGANAAMSIFDFVIIYTICRALFIRLIDNQYIYFTVSYRLI